jgi:hypothetical protein
MDPLAELIEDARTIFETGQPLPARNAGSHYILGPRF